MCALYRCAIFSECAFGLPCKESKSSRQTVYRMKSDKVVIFNSTANGTFIELLFKQSETA